MSISSTQGSLWSELNQLGEGGKQLFRYFDIYICLHSLAATGGVGGVGRMRWKDTIICLSGVRQEYRFEINFKGAQKYAVDFSSGPKFKFIVNQFPVFCGTLLGATYCWFRIHLYFCGTVPKLRAILILSSFESLLRKLQVNHICFFFFCTYSRIELSAVWGV